jgi:hypothetical protein
MLGYLPAATRDEPGWHHIAVELDKAVRSANTDTAELVRLVLSMDGATQIVEPQPPAKVIAARVIRWGAAHWGGTVDYDDASEHAYYVGDADDAEAEVHRLTAPAD